MKYLLTALAVFLFFLGALSRTLAAPSFSLSSPVANQVIPDSSFTASFNLSNPNRLLLWLDQTQFPLASAIKVSSPSYTFTNVKYGPHSLRAELVTTNYLPLVPPVVTTVRFSTSPPPPPVDPSLPTLELLLIICILLAAAFYLVDGQRKAYKKPSKK